MWLNHREFDREDMIDISNTLMEKDMLFDRLSINQYEIKLVQQYEWIINGDEFKKCKALAPSQCVQSPRFTFLVDGQSPVSFHFNFYRQIADNNQNCSIFVEIDKMPENMELLRIEVDMKCNEKKKYRQLMREQILSKKKRLCGCRVFETAELQSKTHLHWVFGVKIYKTAMVDVDTDDMEFEDLYRNFSALY